MIIYYQIFGQIGCQAVNGDPAKRARKGHGYQENNNAGRPAVGAGFMPAFLVSFAPVKGTATSFSKYFGKIAETGRNRLFFLFKGGPHK